jgi:isochorismate synthase EntC
MCSHHVILLLTICLHYVIISPTKRQEDFMTQNDQQLMEWINQHLDIMHSAMTKDEAKMWQRLLMADRQKFDSLALFGFCKRRQRDRKQKKFPGNELAQFSDEFLFKLRLAMKSAKGPFDLPMFELVGRESLEKLGLLSIE